MRYTDVAIVGGGLAGSTAAAMLGRAGVPALLIDPHTVYPPELRCEKLGGDQIDLLRKTGLADATLRATTLDGEVWEARFGYVVARKPSDQHGVMYDALVNALRANCAGRRDDPRQGLCHFQQPGAAEGRVIEWRRNLGTAGFNGERPERRPSPYTRHQASRH
jgi:2-polyprenyl-6-methoxyphenol hydroxylase-like FAD-dependent oxidoreductase